jgi:signal recognition particle subunit SRP54
MLNMGSMGKMMGMIPGVPDYLIPKDGNDDTTKRLRKFMYMMDSMTNAELDGQVADLVYNSKKSTTLMLSAEAESRIRRIARGSGCHPMEVKLLLQTHQQLANMTKTMGKMNIDKNKQAQLQAQMRKNPAALQQRLNQMDPRLLEQMGGREAVLKILQAGPNADSPEAQQAAMAAMMGSMGGGGGAMPGMPPGMDMQQMMQMAQQMGLGGAMGLGGGGGFPGMPPNMGGSGGGMR